MVLGVWRKCWLYLERRKRWELGPQPHVKGSVAALPPNRMALGCCGRMWGSTLSWLKQCEALPSASFNCAKACHGALSLPAGK